MNNRTIAIDFDGTIAQYSGFKGTGIYGKPIDGAVESIKSLKEKGMTIIINTCRSEIQLIMEYLKNNNIPYDYVNYNPKNAEYGLSPAKVYADLYIDDRGVCFDGNWSCVVDEVLERLSKKEDI